MTKQKITFKLHSPVCIKGGKNGTTCRYIPPNPNQRMHWSVKSRWNREWRSEVIIASQNIKSKIGTTPIKGKVAITMLFKSINLMDEDNAVAACKPLIDGLTVKGGSGVLADDTTKHMSIKVKQIKVSKIADQGVEITLAWTQNQT